MNSTEEEDNLSIDNEKDDEFQEKLDFEENELLEENVAIDSNEIKKNDSTISERTTINKSTNKTNDNQGNRKETLIKLKNIKNNGEDGELNDDDDTDDDLEEGELKDDDDPINQSLDVLIKKNEQKNVLCKFYTNGQCTWGEECRFKHSDTVRTTNLNNNQPKPILTTNRSNQNTKYYQKPYNKYDNTYENESRYDDQTNFNGSRTYPPRDKLHITDNRYNSAPYDKDYERKRRLALESAPWNDDYAQDYYADYKSPSVPKDSFQTVHSSSSSFSGFSSTNSEKSFEQSPKVKKRKHHVANLSPDHYSSRTKSEFRKDDDLNSISSFFSDSDSLNDKDEFAEKYKQRSGRSISPNSPSIQKRSRSIEQNRESSKTNYDPYQYKTSSSARSKHGTTNRSTTDHERKPPIKMTFMRKQSSLKKSVKLNDDTKDEFESEAENSDQDDFSPYGSSKDVIIKKKIVKSRQSPPQSTPSSREELLKRLKEIDEAIARKRSKV